MDLEIKRLLKLSNIPGFKLSEEEQVRLDAWKAQQKPVKPKTRKSRVKNVVSKDEKSLNNVES